jgi:hypothetical protein
MAGLPKCAKVTFFSPVVGQVVEPLADRSTIRLAAWVVSTSSVQGWQPSAVMSRYACIYR